MYFITTKRMLEVCFSAHPNIQYRTFFRLMPVSCARCVQVIVWWRRIMKSWRSKCFTVVKTES